MKYINSIFALLFISSACSTSDNDPPGNAHTDSSKPEPVYLDLSAGGLPLGLKMSAENNPEIDAKWNAAFGRMELSDTRGLSIFVIEDTLTCAAKKQEIESGIFDISYIVDTDSLIFYKSALPDGSTPYWHFFASFPVGESNYIFENNPLIECTEKQIEFMTEIVGKIRILNKVNE